MISIKKLALGNTCLCLLALLMGSAAIAESPSKAPIQVSISSQNQAQRLILPKGKSAIVDLPVEARDVIVSNPKVADAVMRSQKRGFLLGVDIGETNVYFLDAQGRQILALEVRVARDTSELGALIEKLAPEARVNIEAVGENLIISGETPDGQAADKVLKIASQFTGDEKKVVNMMTVRSGQQVMLQVRVVEMQRAVIKQLGVNLAGTNLLNKLLPKDWGLNFATSNGFSANGSFLGGTTVDYSWARNFITPSTYTFNAENASLLDPSIFTGAGGYKFTPATSTTPAMVTYGPGTIAQSQTSNAGIQALERVGLARTLAEPNLTAISGEPAKFLVGGEFPMPVSQTNGQFSVEFKPFGVGIGFTPMVLSPERIVLKISAEVSEISSQNSFRQPDSYIRDSTGNIVQTITGLSIPGLTSRKAESTVELASGRSIMMAGLIQQTTRQASEGLPGLRGLPTLGALFSSKDFVNNETELVIIVTPYLVQSTTMDKLQTPADGYNPAGDINSSIMGHLNRIVRHSDNNSGDNLPHGEYRAPIGHTLQ